MSSCRSEGVFVLYRDEGNGRKTVIGWFDLLAEAICAMQEERAKEDGILLEIKQEILSNVRLDQR